MKYKAVFKVTLSDEKKRSKALKAVVGFPGVTKAEVQGDDKGKLSVEGEGLDVTALTKRLRKELGRNASVDLVSFQPAGKEKEKEAMKKIQEIFHNTGYIPVHPQPGYYTPYATPAHPYYRCTPTTTTTRPGVPSCEGAGETVAQPAS